MTDTRLPWAIEMPLKRLVRRGAMPWRHRGPGLAAKDRRLAEAVAQEGVLRSRTHGDAGVAGVVA
ncbi:MAG: hypothetical protein H0V44_08665, partial [Planctomycetes bacterium]|nr:hypothetical protein [Planctomycetota bacterium]